MTATEPVAGSATEPPALEARERLAAIDVGSNSIRLLVAEYDPQSGISVIDEVKDQPRLAQGLTVTGRLDEHAMARALATLARMREVCRRRGVRRIAAVATAAVREAQNGEAFVQRVREELDIPLRIIDAETEAALSYRSVAHHFRVVGARTLVADIGGGSLELIGAVDGLVELTRSLPLGAVRLTETFLLGKRDARREVTSLRTQIRRHLKRGLRVREWTAATVIGSGGTFTTLGRMAKNLAAARWQVIGFDIAKDRIEEAKAKFAKVAANYEQSLLINPNHAGTYVRLAELLLGTLKDPDRAVKLLDDARRRFPGAPEIVYYLAIAQREAKQSQQAVATFEEALHEAQIEEDAEFVNAKFYFNYGAAAEQAGLYDKAADLLRKSIALDPDNSAEASNYLGYMWADHNMNLDEAETMIRRALQSEPNNASYLDSLGWVEFRKSQFDRALDNLLQAAKTAQREDPVVFEHIGDTYLKLNRSREALEAWQKALSLDPKNKNLADKIQATKKTIGKDLPEKTNPT